MACLFAYGYLISHGIGRKNFKGWILYVVLFSFANCG